MRITRKDLDKAHAQYSARYGGKKEDYFALLYLTREFDKSPDQVAAISLSAKTSRRASTPSTST